MLNYSGKILDHRCTFPFYSTFTNDTEKGTSFSPSALYDGQLCNPAHSPGYSLDVEWWLVGRDSVKA